MERVATVGFDIAKSVFQVHGIDATGTVVVRRKLSRGRVLTFFEALPEGLLPTRGLADSLALPKSSRVRIDGGEWEIRHATRGCLGSSSTCGQPRPSRRTRTGSNWLGSKKRLRRPRGSRRCCRGRLE